LQNELAVDTILLNVLNFNGNEAGTVFTLSHSIGSVECFAKNTNMNDLLCAGLLAAAFVAIIVIIHLLSEVESERI
jgi:hypothetical protein